MVIADCGSVRSQWTFATATHGPSCLLDEPGTTSSYILCPSSLLLCTEELHSCDRKMASRTPIMSSPRSGGIYISSKSCPSFGSRTAFLMRKNATVAKSLSAWITVSTSVLRESVGYYELFYYLSTKNIRLQINTALKHGTVKC